MCKKKDGDCPKGYEGNDCKTEIRAKFYGTYSGTLVGGGQNVSSFTTLKEYVGDVEKINWDNDGYLKVTGSTTFDIPKQQINSSGTIMTVEGNGSLNGNQLKMEFSASLSGVSVDFTYTGTRQKTGPVLEKKSVLKKIYLLLIE